MTTRPVLVPAPRSFESLPGRTPISGSLRSFLTDCSLADPPPPELNAEIDPRRVRHAQGYALTLEAHGIRLQAADRPGLFYGLMTLRQLARQAEPPGQLPNLHIEDWPELPVRGVMLDISRNRVPTLDTLRGLIDRWAELKLNQVQLYMEHTFAYPSHPEVWREASPLTPAEVAELDRYCAGRAVELVPCQNSFGHMERWLIHEPYRGLAECPEGFTDPWGVFREHPSTLNPLDPASFELVAGLYDELLPHFSSRLLCVGGDEPWELGQGRSREVCRIRGRGRVYLDFLLRLRELGRERGRTMQFYGDIVVHHPELVRELPRDMVALEWGYEADHPFERECGLLAAAGVPFHVCPGTSSWNSLAGRWENARENIRQAVREGLRAGASGFLLTDWGDHGHWQQYPVAFPALFFGAAAAWCPGTAEALDVPAALSRHLFLDDTGEAAQALLGLAGLYRDGVARLHNAGVLAILLQPPLQPYYREELERHRGYGFQRELDGAAEALRLLGRARCRAADGALLGAELDFTAELMAHAARLGRARFAVPHGQTERVPGAVRRELALKLDGLVERYRELWSRRSRPGGLAESAGRFRPLRDAYGRGR